MKKLMTVTALLLALALCLCPAFGALAQMADVDGETVEDAMEGTEVSNDIDPVHAAIAGKLYEVLMASATLTEMDSLLLSYYETDATIYEWFNAEQITALDGHAQTLYANAEDQAAEEDVYQNVMASLAALFGEYDAAVYAAGYYWLKSKGSGTKYSTLYDAFENCAANDTIYVNGTVTETKATSACYRKGTSCEISIEPDPNLESGRINFQNSAVSGSGRIVVRNNHKVTIKKILMVAQHDPKLLVSKDKAPLILIQNNGVVNIETDTELVYGDSIVYVEGNGTFNMNAGTLRKATSACITAVDNAKVNIKGGIIRGWDSSSTKTTKETISTPKIIVATDNAKVNMSAGSVYGATDTCVDLSGASEFEMSGGNIYPCAEANSAAIKNYGKDASDLTPDKLQNLMTEAGYWDKSGENGFNTAEYGVYVSQKALFKMTGGNIFGFRGRAVFIIGDNDTNSDISKRRPAFHFSGGELFCNANNSDGSGIKVTNNKNSVAGNDKIYMGGIVIMSGNAKVSRNVGVNGGGVRVEWNTSFHMQGGTIEKNVAYNTASGGDGGSGGGGGVRLVGAEYLMSNGSITGNKAFGENLEQKYNGGGIGAVWQQGFGNVDTKLVISGGSITNNWSNKNGGGIAATDKGNDHGSYSAGINVSISGGTIANNSTNDCGGGVYVGGNSTVKITGGYIRDNVAAVNGGGLTIELGSLELGNNAGEVTNNRAVDGGGVYMGSRGGTATLYKGAKVSNNTATRNGGGFYFEGGGIDANLNLYGGEIKTNTATKNGGGVYVDRANVNVGMTTSEEKVTISGNTAIDGAGMYLKQAVGSQYQINVVKGTIENNTASGNGGAVCIVDGTNIFIGAEGSTVGPQFSSNNAQNGAGMAVYGGSPIVYGGTFTNNSARTDGGAIYVNNGSVTMYSGEMASNTAASGNGGAINIATGDFTMHNGMIGGNAESAKNSAVEGGAVYVSGGTFTMHDGSINFNAATTYGGAVFMKGGNFTMHHGTINNNTAVDGGAMYMDGTADTIFKMESGHMSYNIATSDGGAVYSTMGRLEFGLEKCTQEVSLHKEPCHHPRLENNKASACGGAIAIYGNGQVYFYCGVTQHNDALYPGVGENVFMKGGDLYVHDGAMIGDLHDPNLVIIGGKLHNEREDANNYVKLRYHSHNLSDSSIEMETAIGEAYIDGYMNLPSAEYFWNTPPYQGWRFFGWTPYGSASETDYEYVRNQDQYQPSGSPVLIRDTEKDAAGNVLPTYDGEANMTMNLYALWAPPVSYFTYVDVDMSDGSFTEYKNTASVETRPTYSYTFAEADSLTAVPPFTQAGYKQVGWYIYQDEGQNANWGWEPSYTAGAEKTYENLILDNLHYVAFSDLEEGKLNTGNLHFGNLTLIAKYEPQFAKLTINKAFSGVAADDSLSYIFRVVGDPDSDDHEAVDMYVTIQGDGSVTLAELPVGSYTVTEMNDWSWRYENAGAQTKDVKNPEETTVFNFTNSLDPQKTQWLDDEYGIRNDFGDRTVTILN